MNVIYYQIKIFYRLPNAPFCVVLIKGFHHLNQLNKSKLCLKLK